MLVIKFMRNSHEHSSAISRIVVGRASSPMLHPLAQLASIFEHLLASAAVDVDDETHAASVLFQGGVVEALLGRRGPPVGVERHLDHSSEVHF